MQSISTFSRFLYLNAYAFLLIGVGISIWFLLFIKSWIVIVICALTTVICFYYAIHIFSTWYDKKRNYQLLIQRNTNVLRAETFRDFMKAPCGRLLCRIVLEDLNYKDEYKNLKKAYSVPFSMWIKNVCTHEQSVIVFFDSDVPKHNSEVI